MNGINADNADRNSQSEKVLGAVFEVSNTLSTGFLERGLPAAFAQRTQPPWSPGHRRNLFRHYLQGPPLDG
jgi:hypothetical protein